MIRPYAVFEPAGHTTFTLHCGNAEAPEPVYESAPTLASLEARALPACRVTKLEARAGGEPLPAETGQTMVWVLLGLTTAVTAWLLWRAARPQ